MSATNRIEHTCLKSLRALTVTFAGVRDLRCDIKKHATTPRGTRALRYAARQPPQGALAAGRGGAGAQPPRARAPAGSEGPAARSAARRRPPLACAAAVAPAAVAVLPTRAFAGFVRRIDRTGMMMRTCGTAAGVATVAVAALAASASAYDFACSNAGCECSGSNCGKSVFHWTR